MDDAQFKKFMNELSDIKRLLILNTLKTGITSDAVGKCLGVDGSRIRQISSGFVKKSDGGKNVGRR